jgi:adenylate kinase
MKLVFLGPPASGKGTYASRICEKLGIPQISTGDLFRDIVKTDSVLGMEVKRIMDAGGLQTDEITNQIVKERLSKPDAEKGFILDGYPRSLNQADALEKMSKLDAVVNIAVPESVVMERVVYRVSCEKCGSVYNTKMLKPKKEGVCDKCGYGLKGRADQTEESMKTRLKLYYNLTKPLEDYYRRKGLLIEVYNDKADIDPQVMVDRILDALAEKGIK